MLVNPLLSVQLEASLLQKDIERHIEEPSIAAMMMARTERIVQMAGEIQRPVKPVRVAE